MAEKRVLILGAAGRDFQNFNTFYRDNEDVYVVGFTAAQIPDINDRVYPPELAGDFYPDGIQIFDEDRLEELIRDLEVDECVFSYSDVSADHIMRVQALCSATGANLTFISSKHTMIVSNKPTIGIVAVRTGCGKSQLSREVIKALHRLDRCLVPIRHPMPYDPDLNMPRVQRFGDLGDLDRFRCTIEEMEEYEPHIKSGGVIFAGVDYGDILDAAEKEADIILWDGGNNDTSFYYPDVLITIVDALRPGDELKYYPGYENFITADIIVINKVDAAEYLGQRQNVDIIRENIRKHNPGAKVILANSPVELKPLEAADYIRGQRVLVVEDGPSLTHGGLKIGAGTMAARMNGASDFVDPRPYAHGLLKRTFERYPDVGILLPAMGYGARQIRDLERTIKNVADANAADTVVIGTPIDLGRIIEIPDTLQVADLSYSFAHRKGQPHLDRVILKLLAEVEK